jgi:prepilin-type N-terminal cleavage/methylation domain-containing protein
MTARRRRSDAGLTLMEMMVALTLMAGASVAFIGAGAVTFGRDAKTTAALGDLNARNVVGSKLRDDLRDSTDMGTQNAPCAVPPGGTLLLWARTGAQGATGSSPVVLYYTTTATPTGTTATTTTLMRTECAPTGSGQLAAAAAALAGPDLALAHWDGTAAAQVQCNGRAPGDGCGGSGTLTGTLAADADTVATFAGTPTGAPVPVPTYADAPADRLRIGNELAVITAGWGTSQFSVQRPNAADQPAGTTVSFAPTLVQVCVPFAGGNCVDPGSPAVRVLVARRLP